MAKRFGRNQRRAMRAAFEEASLETRRAHQKAERDLAQTIAAIIDPVAWDRAGVAWDRAGQVGPGRRALKPSERTEKMDRTRREGSLRKARKVIEAFEAHFLDPDGAGDLSWNVFANLRWLANNHGLRGHMPCGMLPGAFLLIVADRLEASSSREQD